MKVRIEHADEPVVFPADADRLRVCGYCGAHGRHSSLPVSASHPNINLSGADQVTISGGHPPQDASFLFACPHCHGITVVRGANHEDHGEIVTSPSPKVEFAKIDHLPSDVLEAWDEANAAYSAGAPTAAEVMCRKLLAHVAEDRASEHVSDKARNRPLGPNFFDYVQALEMAHVFGAGLAPLLTAVKDNGNEANHVLTSVGSSRALATMRVTAELLRQTYELPTSLKQDLETA